MGLACTRRKSGSSATSITPYGDIASASQVETSGAPSELRSAEAGRSSVVPRALATAASARASTSSGRGVGAVRDDGEDGRRGLRLLLDGVDDQSVGVPVGAVALGARGGHPDRTRCLDDLLDVLDDPLEGHALLQVAVGADGHGLLGHLGRAEAGEDDDLGLRDQAPDRGQRLEAVHHGHRQVEQHDVGLLEADALDAGQAVPGLADDLEPATGEGQAQQLAQVVGVVDDDDPHGAGALGDRDHGVVLSGSAGSAASAASAASVDGSWTTRTAGGGGNAAEQVERGVRGARAGR